MKLKIRALKQTKDFYLWELEKESLTEKERDKYLKALKIVEKIIKEKEKAEEKGQGYLKGGDYKKWVN